MQRTKIEWCTMTWNPVTGCLNGCPYCYAKKIAERFGKDLWPKYCGVAERREPMYRMTKNGKLAIAPYPFGFKPTLHRYRLDEPQKIKKPQRIFVVSMGDLFGPWVPDHWITEVFDACKKAPQHKYMFLTKFPKRYIDLADKGLLPKLDNFWYGQSASDKTVEAFLRPNGGGFSEYHQFVSAEPLVGFVQAIWFELVIIGAETGNRKDKILPSYSNVKTTIEARDYFHSKVFMKDSLIPIVGEEEMIREIPEELLIKGKKHETH